MMLSFSVLLLAIFALLANATRVSLTDSPAWQSKRPCMDNCFGNKDVNYLAQNLKVGNTNEGVCRQDIQPLGVQRLRTCIGTWCDDNELDINYGISMYTAYCTGAGYTGAIAAATTTEGPVASNTPAVTTPLPSPAQKSSSNTFSAPSIPPEQTNSQQTNSFRTSTTTSQTLAAQSTPPAAGSGTNGKGISNETIGIIVGVIGVVVALIGVYYTRKAFQKKNAS